MSLQDMLVPYAHLRVVAYYWIGFSWAVAVLALRYNRQPGSWLVGSLIFSPAMALHSACAGPRSRTAA